MEDLTAIAEQLEANAQAIRIKKLLLYATAGTWESDPMQLQATKIMPMLMQLRQLYPTTQQLRFYLYTIVANLTKPQEYQKLANLILLECQVLYTQAGSEEDEEPTAFFSAKATPTPAQADGAMIEQQCKIAQMMELSFDRPRIVKLLLCLLYEQWESDAEKIAQTSIRALLDEIWQKFVDLPDLERGLAAIVQRLSKPLEYSGVATQIVEQMAFLYGVTADEREGNALPLVSSIDGFDLRLELMKFTNPLRVKILLFSLVEQPFEFNEAAWSALKRYSLETLLKKLLETYSTANMADRLWQTAHALPEAEDYHQAAEVLMRALKLPTNKTAIGPLGSSMSPNAEDDDITGIHLSPVIVKSAIVNP